MVREMLQNGAKVFFKVLFLGRLKVASSFYAICWISAGQLPIRHSDRQSSLQLGDFSLL
jgi:hypothetical protein